MSLQNILSKRNRVLLRELVVTDFKLRYQGSVLGYLWSLLKPLFLFAILLVIFGHFLKVGERVEHFSVYLLLGIVFWTFFTEATNQGLASIVNRGDLIRKINFPKYIIVISSSLSALINMLLNLLVVGFFLILNGVELGPSAWLFPLYVLELYILAVSIAFFLSAAYVKYRDVSHIWEVLLQGAFYATPILYPVSYVLEQSEFIAKLLLLNPVAQIIQDSRQALITDQTVTLPELTTNLLLILTPFAIVCLIAIGGALYFKKYSGYFSEEV